MKGRTLKLLAVGIVLLLVVVGVGVGLYLMTGGRTYTSDMNSLRAEFNKDRGRVRVLLLLSPT